MNSDDFELLSKLDDILSGKYVALPLQAFIVLYPSGRGYISVEWLQHANIHTTVLFSFTDVEEYRTKAKDYIKGNKHV